MCLHCVSATHPAELHELLLNTVAHGDCLEWFNSAVSGGKRYGIIRDGDEQVGTHRIAFFFAHGRWPEPLCCHTCDNPPCINPAHLFEGTHRDNAQDMVQKGRAGAGRPKGSKNKIPAKERGPKGTTRGRPRAQGDSMAGGTTEFSAQVPNEEYQEFRENFPQYGASKWFINLALKEFNEQCRTVPNAHKLVNTAINRMLAANRGANLEDDASSH